MIKKLGKKTRLSWFSVSGEETVSSEDEPGTPVLVTFALDDPGDPRNWSSGKKIRVVAILCALSFCACVAMHFSTLIIV